MGDWDDVFGNDNPEWCGKEDDPDEIWSYRDKTCYKDALEMAKLGLGFDELVIDNHVFTTYEEAANAARELAIKTQSAVKIFINQAETIYSIYDSEMDKVINSVQTCEIDSGYYPKSPLIRLREKDFLYHENSGNWLLIAHPNGTTENLERNICGCIKHVLSLLYYNPFDCFEYNSFLTSQNQLDELKKSLAFSSIHERSEVLNKSLTIKTIRERDNLFEMASIIAKSHEIKVYIVRLREKIDKCGIYQIPRYVMFTEERLNELITQQIECDEKSKIEKEQELKESKELDDYKSRTEIVELKKNAKTKISKILESIIDDNCMSISTYDYGIYYGKNHDKFFLVKTDNTPEVDGKGIFQLIHLIMCEEGIYKMILSDNQYDDIEGVIADHPVSIYGHAGIGGCNKLQSTLDEIYKESITIFVNQLQKREQGGCIREHNFELYLSEWDW